MDAFVQNADQDYMQINPDKKNKVDLPYAAFRFAIRWNVDKIAGCKNAEGFIVQKINISAPEYLRSFPVKEYFEAWEVRDGEIQYPKNVISKSIDDCFSVDESTAFESIGRKGQVIYQAKVYWVDYRDSLFEAINKWKVGEIIQAGKHLRSKDQCSDLDSRCPRFVRPDFVHDFDFTDSSVIKDVALRFGRNLYSCPRRYERDNFRSDYQDAFFEAGLSELFESVILQLESEYPIYQTKGDE